MENIGFTLDELKKQNPEKYFQEILDVDEFDSLKQLVQDSSYIISWGKLIEEGVVKIEGEEVEGIYWKGDLDLKQTSIKSLWKLKEVNGNLDLQLTEIKSLGNLKKVGGNLDCYWMLSLSDLGDLEEVGGYLDIKGTKVKSLGKLKKIGQHLDCKGVGTLEDTGDLVEVGGWFNLSETWHN